MYKILDNLTEENKNALLGLQSEVYMQPATSYRRRVGVNGPNNLSVYNFSKYLNGWTRHQRKTFMDNFPDPADEKAVAKWFLEIPAVDGQIDKTNTWQNEASAAWVTSYNLKGAGNITIGDEEVIVPEGKGITFQLSIAHGITKTSDGTLWACVMHLDNLWNV